MTLRTCCFTGCGKPAEWEMWPSTAVYEFVDACTDHVGHLLDDAPETRIVPLQAYCKEHPAIPMTATPEGGKVCGICERQKRDDIAAAERNLAEPGRRIPLSEVKANLNL